MGNGMNKILPGLYLGNLHDSKDQQQLTNNKITHIVSAFDSAKPSLIDKKYLCLLVSDSALQDIAQYFVSCAHFVHQARLHTGAVLVHCLAGVSRSSTLVIAYLMMLTGLGWKECYAVVRRCRPCANPNFGFQRQLLNFQYNCLHEERNKFLEEYSEFSHLIEEDVKKVKKMLQGVKEEDEKLKKKVDEEDEKLKKKVDEEDEKSKKKVDEGKQQNIEVNVQKIDKINGEKEEEKEKGEDGGEKGMHNVGEEEEASRGGVLKSLENA